MHWQNRAINQNLTFKSQFIELAQSTEISKKLPEICRPKQWPTVATQYFTNDGYPVYGANGQIGYYTEYNHDGTTIMIACRGATCGSINVGYGKIYANGNAMCLDNVREDVDLRYLEYALRTYDFSTVITGSAQPQITANNLEKVIIPLPDISIQQQFAAFAEQSDKSKFELEQAIQRIDNLIKSLIQQKND